MDVVLADTETNLPFFRWQVIIDWAEKHYRCRTFAKDEAIPARNGLLYLVQSGTIRMVGHLPKVADIADPQDNSSEPSLLGFVGGGQPFELVTQLPLTVQAYSHTNNTQVIWIYWQELDNWPHFRREILDAFRYQHQRQLLLLSVLGQQRTIDRLYGFLSLLIEEHGQPYLYPQGGEHKRYYCLPWPLTQAQIASAIGATRVTVTRLMGKLRNEGLIHTTKEDYICLLSTREV